MWYKFAAYNTEARYGWTQDEAVAAAALEWLNKGREINVYSMEALGDDTDEFEGIGNLADRNDHLFTDDTRAEDFEVEA